MKLRFAKGAVVSFGFKGQVEGLCNTGKVVNVTEDEVIVIPQEVIQIPRNDTRYEGDYYPQALFEQRYSHNMTCDSGREVHIDRSLIAGWEYHTIATDCGYTKSVRLCDAEKFPELLNHYGDDGFCRGSGENFDT